MYLVKNFFGETLDVISLNVLHTCNDGFEAGYLLLLPFIAKTLHISLTQVGFLGTLMSIFSIFLAVPAGYIALRVGGFKTLLAAVIIYSIGLFGVGISHNYIELPFVFVLGGIGFALFHPIAFAMLAKWTTSKNRGSVMGNFTALGDIGKIGIAAIITPIIVYIGWQKTAVFYGIFALLVATILYRRLSMHDIFTKREQKSSKVSIWAVIKHKLFLLTLSANFLDNVASQSLFVFLPFLLLKKGVSPQTLGIFMGAYFVGNFVGKIFLGKLVDGFDTTRIFIISELLMAIAILILANTTPLILIIICSLFLGIFTKGTVPILQTMVSESAEHHGDFEKAYGFTSIVSNTAETITPLFLGFISDKFSIIRAFDVMAVFAILAIIPASGFYFAKKSKFIRI